MSRSSQRRCSLKTVFLEIPQNSQENTCIRDFFLIKLQALGTFFTEQLRTTASYCLKFLEIKRSWFGSISYWVYCLGRYYLVNCNCNLVLQKLHSVYAGKILAKIWMFELQDFKYLYGMLWQNYLYQENIGKIITCHYMWFLKVH